MQITFEEEKHAYTLDGVRVPSVSQVLAPLTDWSHVPAWQLESAREIGRDVHAAVNLLARDALDWGSLDPAIAPYVHGAQLFLRASGATVLAAEQRVASKLLGVAGTLDLLLDWDGWHYFVDWKVSDTVPKTVGAQLAAYELLYSETYLSGRKFYKTRRLCVRLKHNDYSSHRCADFRGDLNLFKSCVTTFHHRGQR